MLPCNGCGDSTGRLSETSSCGWGASTKLVSPSEMKNILRGRLEERALAQINSIIPLLVDIWLITLAEDWLRLEGSREAPALGLREARRGHPQWEVGEVGGEGTSGYHEDHHDCDVNDGNVDYDDLSCYFVVINNYWLPWAREENQEKIQRTASFSNAGSSFEHQTLQLEAKIGVLIC